MTNTETQPVLIVAKTHRGGGACIGAIAADGRSLRLQAANAGSDEHAGQEYSVGDVWEVTFGPHPQIIAPHVETVVVYSKRRLRQGVDPIKSIERFMPPVAGGIDALYGGLLRSTAAGALYVAQAGIPPRSTLFWKPDRPLRLVTNGVRLHYCYPGDEGDRRLTFVGCQEPLAEIPAGAIVRVSLAHWWRPDDRPEDELRCYVQLSGWFLPEGAPVAHAPGSVETSVGASTVREGEPHVGVRATQGDTIDDKTDAPHVGVRATQGDTIDDKTDAPHVGVRATQGDTIDDKMNAPHVGVRATQGDTIDDKMNAPHVGVRATQGDTIDDKMNAPHVGVRATPFTPSPAHPLTRVRRTLRDVFGYDSFRPYQEEIVTALLAGRDTLAVMPTGAGKSLCYQLPALLWERLTVVVSPLIALMQDQVDALGALGVPAAYLNSTLTYAEQRRLMERVSAGEIKLLYVAPETLVRPEVLHLLDERGVDCLAVDEAHCISSWGHDFRPEYRQLEPVRRRFANAVCLAMTATAAPRVRADIKQQLGITDAGEIVASFDRPNLFLRAQPRGNGKRDLLVFLDKHRGESGIIYCTARRTVDELAAFLQTQGHAALPYHAGLDDQTRRRHQRAFVRDETPIIVATVAFGMGINKPNVRFVVHYNLPNSIEQYYQEIGRAGRDGLRADCLLLHHPQDIVLQMQMVDDGAAEERAGRAARLQAMVRYAQARTCRRPPLLHYFGEERGEQSCDFCDNCAAPAGERPQTDVTEDARKFFACVQHTNQLFGAAHLIDVLRGSRSQKVLDRRHDRLPEYGAGRDHSAQEWRDLAQQWLQGGLLEQDMQHGGLRLTARGQAVLRGEERAFVEVRDTPQVDIAEGRASVLQGAGLPPYDAGLFEHLRKLRRELADAANLPPYVIFSDRSLIEMAAYLPQTPEELLAVNGVGRAKLGAYGAQFLGAIADYAAAHGLQAAAARRPPQRQEIPPSGSPPPQPALHLPTGGRRAGEIGALYAQGRSLAELQALYDVKRSTVISHLRDYAQNGGVLDAARLAAECSLPAAVQERIFALFADLGSERLGPVHDALEGEVLYDDLHLLRLVWWMKRS